MYEKENSTSQKPYSKNLTIYYPHNSWPTIDSRNNDGPLVIHIDRLRNSSHLTVRRFYDDSNIKSEEEVMWLEMM